MGWEGRKLKLSGAPIREFFFFQTVFFLLQENKVTSDNKLHTHKTTLQKTEKQKQIQHKTKQNKTKNKKNKNKKKGLRFT